MKVILARVESADGLHKLLDYMLIRTAFPI